VDVCLASEIIPALLSSESSPTMCHAELFREATGGGLGVKMLDSDSRSVQNAMLSFNGVLVTAAPCPSFSVIVLASS